MNWDAIAAVGQMLGSIAVFITLGYLAVQVRHARDALRRSISQDRLATFCSLTMARATNQQLAAVFAKADESFGAQPYPFVATVMRQAGLTRQEALLVNGEQAAWLNYRAQVFSYIDELPPPDRVLFDAGIRLTYGRGVARAFYETTGKSIAHPDFVRYIDNLLVQPG